MVFFIEEHIAKSIVGFWSTTSSLCPLHANAIIASSSTTSVIVFETTFAVLPRFQKRPVKTQLQFKYFLLSAHHTPRPNHVVRVAREQGLAVGAPGQAHALGLSALLADLRVLGLQLVDLALLLQVEDDDGARGRGAQPVPVGREDERVDLVAGRQRVQVLRLVQIPQHRRAVFAARGAQRSVG